MGPRTLLLTVSVLMAAVGVALVGLYVRGADQRADDRAQARYGPVPKVTAAPSPAPTLQHKDLAGYGFTVELQDADRAIGLMQPGDLIAVYVTAKQKQPDCVVDRIRVVSVGTRQRPGTEPAGETVPATVIGLDGTLDQAVAIEAAQSKGTLVAFVLGSREASTAAATVGSCQAPSTPVASQKIG